MENSNLIRRLRMQVDALEDESMECMLLGNYVSSIQCQIMAEDIQEASDIIEAHDDKANYFKSRLREKIEAMPCRLDETAILREVLELLDEH